jgi:cyanophycin synthetase
VAEDISRSIWETSGGILEVNCDTGFALIQFPTSGDDIDPGPAVIETLFPQGAPVRVPLVAVTGGRDTTEISRIIGRMLTDAGHATGIALQDGLYLGKTRLAGIDSGGTSGKRRVLLNPAVEMAVLECPSEEIVAQGLAFEQCDVAVVTSLSGVAPAELPQAESVICRTLAPEGLLVVPADDAAVIELARSFGRSIVLYGIDAERIERQRQPGDRTVTLRSSGETTLVEIFWGDGGAQTIPLPELGGYRVEVVLAAVAAALAVGRGEQRIDPAHQWDALRRCLGILPV